jgi:hypothetical protein
LRGLRLLDAFDTAGNFIERVASAGELNAPWGFAMAPANFGKFSGDLLVGNFGEAGSTRSAGARTAGKSTAL